MPPYNQGYKLHKKLKFNGFILVRFKGKYCNSLFDVVVFSQKYLQYRILVKWN